MQFSYARTGFLEERVEWHLMWGLQGFPVQMGCVIPLACSGSFLVSPPIWMWPENLFREARRNPYQMPKPPQPDQPPFYFTATLQSKLNATTFLFFWSLFKYTLCGFWESGLSLLRVVRVERKSRVSASGFSSCSTQERGTFPKYLLMLHQSACQPRVLSYLTHILNSFTWNSNSLEPDWAICCLVCFSVLNGSGQTLTLLCILVFLCYSSCLYLLLTSLSALLLEFIQV